MLFKRKRDRAEDAIERMLQMLDLAPPPGDRQFSPFTPAYFRIDLEEEHAPLFVSAPKAIPVFDPGTLLLVPQAVELASKAVEGWKNYRSSLEPTAKRRLEKRLPEIALDLESKIGFLGNLLGRVVIAHRHVITFSSEHPRLADYPDGTKTKLIQALLYDVLASASEFTQFCHDHAHCLDMREFETARERINALPIEDGRIVRVFYENFEVVRKRLMRIVNQELPRIWSRDYRGDPLFDTINRLFQAGDAAFETLRIASAMSAAK
ncbi:MAG: hypothetical protein GC199_07030 [Alphaproteobacteria bacterium]|nr:hypothetical protein [Alphaproteobacteria bacterium]